MNGAQLKQLAEMSELAKTDITAMPLTLEPESDSTMLSVWYTGQSSGLRRIDVGGDSGLTQSVSIGPSEFRDLASLFDDVVPVKFSVQKSALVITSAGRRVSLRYTGDFESNKTDYHDATVIGSTSLDDFTKELSLAAQMTATSFAIPVLGAVRCIFQPKHNVIGIQSADGISLMFQTAIDADISVAAELLIHPQSVLLALKILRGKTVTLKHLKRSVILETEDTIIRLPNMAGSWPKINLADIQFIESVDIPSSTVRAITAASRIYKSEAGGVTIRPGEGCIIIETKEDETGQFRDIVDGSISNTYKLTIAGLDAAMRVATGDTITMALSSGMARTRSERRSLYIAMRAV